MPIPTEVIYTYACNGQMQTASVDPMRRWLAPNCGRWRDRRAFCVDSSDVRVLRRKMQPMPSGLSEHHRKQISTDLNQPIRAKEKMEQRTY